MQQFTAFVFHYRNVLAALPLAAGFFSARRDLEVNSVSWVLAALLCFAGALLRAWARWHNAYAQGRKKALASTGPYALVRNPLYLGTLLAIAGGGVAANVDWLLPAVIGWAFLVFVVACKHEEGRLLAKYGPSYEAYRARIPAWWPRWPRRAPLPTRRRGFGMVLAAQVLYASLCLVPFLIKGFHPLRLWLVP